MQSRFWSWCTDSFRRYREAVKLFEDLVCGFCPDKRLGAAIVIGDVAPDGVFQFGNGFENPAPDASSRDGREEAFDGVQPGRGSGRKVKDPSRVVRQPLIHVGVLVVRCVFLIGG